LAKKVDLEAGFRAFFARAGDAAQAEDRGDFPGALDRAEACLPDLSGYIAYLRRYQSVEAPRLPPVELIFRLAPPMFSARSLAVVADWYAAAGRTDRKTYADLPAQLEAARDRLALAVRAWPSWRAASPTGATPDAKSLTDVWVRYGAVAAPAYTLVTHPTRPAVGKCGRCGSRERAPLEDLLGPRECSRCQASAEFVIVARTT
jgi:hypothetical protein